MDFIISAHHCTLKSSDYLMVTEHGFYNISPPLHIEKFRLPHGDSPWIEKFRLPHGDRAWICISTSN